MPRNLPFHELNAFLDEKVALYNHPRFIETDPIQVPHQFTLKEDIEIAAPEKNRKTCF